jgi:hypothetical protein
MTDKNTIFCVVSQMHSRYKENSIVKKFVDSCYCGNCGKFEIYVILHEFEVKESCVTPNYFVVVIGNTIKLMPDS